MRAWELLESNAKKLKMNTPEFRALLTPGLEKIGDIYKKNGFDLRIVGGAVRDLVLGKKPKDIDLASDATPEESLNMLRKEGIRVIETGIQHGTITAIVDGEEFEITTLRIDVETDGRHAKVEYTRNWEKDAERRDLSFNAMSLDLDGNLYDYHGGIEDLKAGKSKFVGNTDARIQEDYLRILRYFRFQGRMDVPDWDKDTLDAIARNADGLQKISGERIWMEFAKIITGNHVVDILSKMKETGVLDQIGISAPSLAEVKRVAENTDVPSTILAVFAKNEEDVDRIAAQWKLSAHERETMRFIVQNRDKKLDEKTAKMMWTDKKVKNHHVIELAKYLGKQNLVDMLENWQTPTFPVTGKDLQAVGIKPGPAMGQILAKLEAKWKESGYTLDKDQLLGMI